MILLLEGFSRINAKSTTGAFLEELELAPSARLPVEAAVYGFACFFFEVFFGAATAGAPSTDTRRSARLERRGAALTAALAAYVATTSGDYLNPLRWTPCCRCPNRRLHSLWPSPPRWSCRQNRNWNREHFPQMIEQLLQETPLIQQHLQEATRAASQQVLFPSARSSFKNGWMDAEVILQDGSF